MKEFTRHRSNIIDVEFGKDVVVVDPVNLYGCTLDDEVFIGPFVEIQENVKIGNKTKVQSHTFICSLVTIGSECFISHGVMFVNDKFEDGRPAMGDKNKWKSTKVSNNVSIGSGAVILPVKICENVVIGAGAVVTKDIDQPGTYIGNPARILMKNK